LRAIGLHESKRQHYFQYVCLTIMKSQKEFRSLKIELMKSMNGSNSEYFGLSLENLIENR
ncbi:MAG: hypothetical protein L7R49_04335, partial [Nitrosopumilus sp.]|nr:hypothetical protein [Nitrosopumilus sp.]